MEVKIKDSNYVTNIIGSRQYESRYFHQPHLPNDYKTYNFKEVLDYVGDDDIKKTDVLSDYFEAVEKDWSKGAYKTYTLLAIWAIGCFSHAVAQAIVHQDTSLLAEEMPVMAGVAGLLLSCGVTESGLQLLARKKDEEIREIGSNLRDKKRQEYKEERERIEQEEKIERQNKEEKYHAAANDLLKTPEINEVTNPQKMAVTLADVKFDAINEAYKENLFNIENFITMPGVQEFINKQLVEVGKEKDSDFYRDNNRYRIGMKITPENEESLILDFYLDKENSGHVAGEEYRVARANDDNSEHAWAINLLHRDYSEYPNFEYRVVDNKDDYAEIRHCSPDQLRDIDIEKIKTTYLNEHGDFVEEVLKEKEESKTL